MIYVMKLVGELEGATIKIEALDTKDLSEYSVVWYCTVEREDIGFRETRRFNSGGTEINHYDDPYEGHGDYLLDMYNWFVCNAKKSAQLANQSGSEMRSEMRLRIDKYLSEGTQPEQEARQAELLRWILDDSDKMGYDELSESLQRILDVTYVRRYLCNGKR